MKKRRHVGLRRSDYVRGIGGAFAIICITLWAYLEITSFLRTPAFGPDIILPWMLMLVFGLWFMGAGLAAHMVYDCIAIRRRAWRIAVLQFRALAASRSQHRETA